MRDKTPQESMAESLVATLKLLREQEQINEQLKAQVDAFREFAELIVEWKEYGFRQAKILLDSTPSQHLAEIKAQAVIDAIDAHKNKLLTFDFDTAIRVTDLIKYANKLRQSVKE